MNYDSIHSSTISNPKAVLPRAHLKQNLKLYMQKKQDKYLKSRQFVFNSRDQERILFTEEE